MTIRKCEVFEGAVDAAFGGAGGGLDGGRCGGLVVVVEVVEGLAAEGGEAVEGDFVDDAPGGVGVGADGFEGDFVFTAPDGAPIDPESAAKVFERRVAKSGLPKIRFHDLRHSHAVHLIAAGQHVKVVSERLGHASTSFTMDRYGHVMPNLQSDAASAVAALVDGGLL